MSRNYGKILTDKGLRPSGDFIGSCSAICVSKGSKLVFVSIESSKSAMPPIFKHFATV